MSPQGSAEILVVEDDRDVREAILDTLEEEGHPAAGASGGAEALQYLREAKTKPRLILLDLMMPGMNGAQFREQQLGDPALAGIPVIILSADGSTPQASVALDAAGFLRKPVKVTALLAEVARFTGQ